MEPECPNGVVEVHERLKGDAKRGHVYLKINVVTVPTSSEDIAHQPGQLGLWLLSRPDLREPDLFVGTHPQRFVPESDAATVAELISLVKASDE